jgi:hypothetical protein
MLTSCSTPAYTVAHFSSLLCHYRRLGKNKVVVDPQNTTKPTPFTMADLCGLGSRQQGVLHNAPLYVPLMNPLEGRFRSKQARPVHRSLRDAAEFA